MPGIDNKLPRAKQAMASDAIGTVASAALGTSTVTSFIESAALTIVSAMMMQNVAKIEWKDYTESRMKPARSHTPT
jgi:xanthine/uracil/vitamin C permease (AzgA family)